MPKPVPVEVESDDCLVTVNGEKCAVHEGERVWLFKGQSVSEMRVVSRLAQMQVQVDALKDSGDTAAAPFFLLPALAREESGALDVVYYAGQMDDDDQGSYRRARMVDPAAGFAPSVVVEKPVTYLQARDDPRWLGDYTGLALRGGRLYTSYVVNTDGTAHIAFARPALP